MSDKGRSFLSTSTGVVTSVAALLTATVGIITAGATLGWFGDKSSSDKSPPPATVTTTVDSPTTTLAAAKPQFTVNPASLTFQALASNKQTVTVQNTGDQPFTLPVPAVDGVDAAQFSVRSLTCGSALQAGRSCDLEVTFAASKGGTSKANLVVQPRGAVSAKEVPLEGSALL